MSSDLLFIYGTLRPGTGHRMHEILARQGNFVDRAKFQGRMFLVARYPGVVESASPNDSVIGDVYRLPTPAPLLRQLDRYEACDPANPDAPYIRVVREVTLTSGQTVGTWIYLYTRNTAVLTRIASGDFLKR
jgi:pyruvate carboxylase